MSPVEKILLSAAFGFFCVSFAASSQLGAIHLTLSALCLIAFAVAIR